MAGGYAVDLEALHRAAQGVRATVEAVEVGSLDGVGTAAGHDRLDGAIAEFASRWQRGVEALTEDGRSIAERLGAAEAAYRASDANAQGMLRGSGPDPAGG